MAKIIEIESVYKTYGTRTKTDVLKNVTLSFERNSFSWLVGASGSGKTTLLNLISGLDSVSKGEIRINDKAITKMKEKEKAKFRAHHLGFVFQFHYLMPEFTALENVLIPLEIQGTKITKKIKADAIALMEKIGLGHVYTHYPKEMSGGEQQRTAIARAIFAKPDVIIADEPTGNLDSVAAASVYEIIRDLHQTYGITFIVVTHDQITPQKNERVIRLHDGEIIEDKVY
ncbi:MAG: ABC transporter ATP-binding protein [Acholeplasmataceae bacterium]|nr:ABC transporter ATP-binding protein [Acholeplasmataceae bacterium]